jgi:hypothetical protein
MYTLSLSTTHQTTHTPDVCPAHSLHTVDRRGLAKSDTIQSLDCRQGNRLYRLFCDFYNINYDVYHIMSTP